MTIPRNNAQPHERASNMKPKTISRICKAVRENNYTDPRKLRRLARATKFLMAQHCREAVTVEEFNNAIKKVARKAGLSI